MKFLIALLLVLAPVCLRAQDTPQPSISPAAPSVAPNPPASTASSAKVIDAAHLIPLLPDAPAGWSADKPEGSTTQSDGFQITTVGRTYVKGDADDAPTATINIIDSANNQQFQDATKAMWGATSTTPAGYDKAVTVAGLPGFEHFANVDQTGVLWVVAGGRYFVQVETTRMPATELEGWLARIDLKKLAEMK
jgi:hypothetical protein